MNVLRRNFGLHANVLGTARYPGDPDNASDDFVAIHLRLAMIPKEMQRKNAVNAG
jgi:hypothetical protein